MLMGHMMSLRRLHDSLRSQDRCRRRCRCRCRTAGRDMAHGVRCVVVNTRAVLVKWLL